MTEFSEVLKFKSKWLTCYWSCPEYEYCQDYYKIIPSTDNLAHDVSVECEQIRSIKDIYNQMRPTLTVSNQPHICSK